MESQDGSNTKLHDKINPPSENLTNQKASEIAPLNDEQSPSKDKNAE